MSRGAVGIVRLPTDGLSESEICTEYRKAADKSEAIERLARRCGVGAGVIHKVLAANGYSRPEDKPPEPLDKIERLRELAARGLTMQQAADEMDLHYKTVYGHNVRHGLGFKVREKRGSAKEAPSVPAPPCGDKLISHVPDIPKCFPVCQLYEEDQRDLLFCVQTLIANSKSVQEAIIDANLGFAGVQSVWLHKAVMDLTEKLNKLGCLPPR